MSQFPWGRFAFLATGLMGFGYGLMKLTVPTEEELYARLAPDLRKIVDDNRAARIAQEEATRKQFEAQQAQNTADSESSGPIWAGKPPAK